jgi:hypothetical protein
MPTNDEPYDDPSKTKAVDGDVVVQGPDSVGVSVTPRAAETTARRLIRTAKAARAQLARKKDQGPRQSKS